MYEYKVKNIKMLYKIKEKYKNKIDTLGYHQIILNLLHVTMVVIIYKDKFFHEKMWKVNSKIDLKSNNK